MQPICLGFIAGKSWGHCCPGTPPTSAPANPSGVSVDLQVFSNLPFVELILNGQSLGSASCKPGSFASFPAVLFTPGNLTAVGRQSSAGEVLASHTQLAAGPPASIELSLDAPSAATGTGTTLLLDGHDAALVRATIRDANGIVVNNADNLITFAVQSGPGRVAGVHNGDGKSHEPQIAQSRYAYHGLARAVIKVTVDAASVTAADLELLATQIEVGTGDGVQTVAIEKAAGISKAGNIVVTATSPGLAMGKVVIPVSADANTDSVLAVAAASTQLELAFD
jgi:hypothetical protein